jgi:hypothetical protein
MSKEISTKQLSELLDRCFEDGVHMTILTNPEKSDYSPDEVSKIALHAYLLALEDVLEYLEGDPKSLEELLTEGGAAVVLEPGEEVPVIRVPKEDLDYEDS